jgi:transcriptional regulator of heat shock response
MIKKQILDILEEEIEKRDSEIFSLNKKITELENIKNDFIDSKLTNKTFPKDYIKQKKEHAEVLTIYNKKIKETSEIIKQMIKKHDEEIKLLNFEIELLKEKIPKKGMFSFLKVGK